MNQTFNPEEWLATQKKGFGGKVSREVFIAKMKELAGEIEQLKQEIENSAKQKTQLTEKLKTSQTDLTNRDQIIQSKDKEIENLKNSSEQTEQELTAKLAEQEKILQSKDNELKNLQSRPDITNENYQELLNNQEKHKKEDLKPDNLPTDWEKQLENKKDLEEKNKELEKDLKAIYPDYPIIMEEEKPHNVKKYIGELEQKPTTEQLQQAVQKEADKYQDYDNIKVELAKQKEKYQELQSKNKENGISKEEYQKLNQQLQTEIEKNKVLEEELINLSPPIVELGKDKEETKFGDKQIIKEIKKLLTDAINPLRVGIIELLKKQSVNNSLPNNSPTKLPADYEVIKTDKKELLRILEIFKLKILESEEK